MLPLWIVLKNIGTVLGIILAVLVMLGLIVLTGILIIELGAITVEVDWPDPIDILRQL